MKLCNNEQESSIQTVHSDYVRIMGNYCMSSY